MSNRLIAPFYLQTTHRPPDFYLTKYKYYGIFILYLEGGISIKVKIQQTQYRLLFIHFAVFGFMTLDCILGCPIYNIFGVTCPGCGLTRAWLSFLRGDWRQALNYHLLFFPTPLFIFLFAHRDLFPKNRWLDFGLLVFAVSLAVYHIWRI